MNFQEFSQRLAVATAQVRRTAPRPMAAGLEALGTRLVEGLRVMDERTRQALDELPARIAARRHP